MLVVRYPVECSRGERCGMKHNPEKKRESKGKGKGSRSSSSLHVGFGDRNAERDESFGRRKPSPRASLSKKGRLSKRRCPREKPGGETKKHNNSVVVANTLDVAKAGKGVSSLMFPAKRDFCSVCQVLQ